MSEQTPDVEALAEVPEADGWLGHDDELEMYDLRNIAATILASDWLAAREQAAERRGAVRALREASRAWLVSLWPFGAATWLSRRANRIEADHA